MAHPSDANTFIYRHPSAGLRSVGSYQVSGWPWITGSLLTQGEQHKISFPMVTKSITVVASGSSWDDTTMRLTFVSTGSDADSLTTSEVIVGKHYLTFDTNEDSYTLPVKCKEIYLSAIGPCAEAGYTLVAELTGIPTSSMFVLTGSGIDSMY
jgi:hypothetical protein